MDSNSSSTQSDLHSRDGCRAWTVCASAMLSQIIIFGCNVTFGLVFPVLLDEFNQGKAETAWVGSLGNALAHVLSPVAAKLIARFGARKCAIMGSIIASLGLLTTSFVNSIYLMYFTYSFLFAVGVSLSFTSNFDIVPRYFKKNLSIATGLLASGFGIAFLVMSPFLETLLTHVGWRNTYRVISGLALLMCFCAAMYSPHVERDNQSRVPGRLVAIDDRRKNIALLRNGRFVICCLSTGVVYHMGITIPIAHMSRYAQDHGLSPSQAAYLYIGFGVFSLIGRVLCGKVCDIKCVKPYAVCFVASFFMGTSVLVCPFARSFLHFLAFFGFYGLCDGFFATSNFMLVIESCPSHQRTRGYGWFFFSMAFGLASGPPLGGFIADATGSYISVFFTSGSIIVFSAFFLLSINFFKQQNPDETRTVLVMLPEDEEMVVTEKLSVI